MGMQTLRLTQNTKEKPNEHSVEVVLEGDGPRKRAVVNFEFELQRQDWYDLRWYMEDYLQYPMDPNPEIAERIEARMDEIGRELFVKIFGPKGTEQEPILDAFKIWDRVLPKLSETRIEIITDIKGATNIPWELIRTSDGKKLLALTAQEFVHTHPEALETTPIPDPGSGEIRILLVICRPREDRDVPFRSVANQIIKGLGEQLKGRLQLDVLRPPTFTQLEKTLTAAQKAGKPYHVVHFDGHGAYLNIQDLFEKWEKDEKAMLRFLAEWLNISTNRFSPDIIYPNKVRGGNRGYLIFENPESEYNLRLVDGPELGELLQRAGVPVLVLNACRSAHSDPLTKPDEEKESNDIHSQVKTFGSFAQEVCDNGVAGVVAMRYNVYVVTAANFVANLYNSLISGMTLGEAVSFGRQTLSKDPQRSIAFDPVNLQDWSVPVVYEAAPIQLFRKKSGATGPLRLDVTQKEKIDNLPRPEIGFFGRDETLLALDRAFDTQQVVLLHAYAGSGKTMTAAEFARWYQQTGGLTGPILYSKFEQYQPLATVLNAVEPVFRPLLEQNNIQWMAMDTEERLNITIQIFKHYPPLWIWDNIEPVNGFPAGTQSAWTEAEQRELKTFLQIVTGQTKAKFLLTSRRDERAWLGDLPRRVSLPPMPVQERVQLARALAEKQGHKITDVDDWMPLLKFTGGNPLTLTVLVGQALREKIKTKYEIRNFVEKLRSGEKAFEDEISEGRTKSLGASLSYGFETAFTPDERKVLALLHFFQGFVDVDALRMMLGDPEKFKNRPDWCLPELPDLRPSTFGTLLSRAAEIGLLTPHGGGYYTIHPALPWFFRALFEQYYPADDGRPQTADSQATVRRPSSAVALRAYVESMGELGNYYHNTYNAGNRDVIGILRAEEPNLLHARAIALSGLRKSKGDYARAVTSTMQGLQTLYDHTGRRAEWKRLVDEIVPDFVGADDLPIPGREEQWRFVNDYRVWLARESRDWQTAEHLQRNKVEYAHRNAAGLLQRPVGSLDAGEKNSLRSLAASLHELGQIQRELGLPDCAKNYQESLELSENIGERAGAATCAFNLGHAYKNLPALRNLDEAERWYQRSLELRAEGDRLGRGKCNNQLGGTAYGRFNDAKKEEKTKEELLEHLNAAVGYYQQALALLPPDAVDDLAVTNCQLGIVFSEAGDLEQGLSWWQKGITLFEKAGNLFEAGKHQRNISVFLALAERFSDALLYARAALRNFEPYGQGAAKNIEDTKGLIAWIEGKQSGK
jgi:hypothetical protein